MGALDGVSGSGSSGFTPPAISLEDPFPSASARVFSVPVDSEGKAKQLWPIWSWNGPHMRAFQVCWIAFFITYFASFAPAALLPTIRENLSLNTAEENNAGIAAIVGVIGAQIGMGYILDTIGPRLSTAAVLCAGAPCVFLMSMVTDYAGYLVIRLLIGCSTAIFVSTQFWVGGMFNGKLVGTANGFAAGWGHTGAGATLLLMPLFTAGIQYTRDVMGFEAWRWSFFIPGAAYLLCAAVCLSVTEDSPLGDYRDLKKQGLLCKDQGLKLFKIAICDSRMWLLAWTNGFGFGVSLIVDNIIVAYLYDQFGLSQTTAGALGAIFGLMNIFFCASGGMLSDLAGHYFGMRGRLWNLWILQTLGGVFCLLMAYVDYSLGPTVAIMIVFSIFVQQASGAVWGIVPFVSRRAFGVVTGIVGGGGNVGGGITQALWFGATFPYQMRVNSPWSVQDGFKWMGVTMMIMTLFLFFIHFPMWGSMLFPGNPEYSEEEYYLKEWTSEEIAAGMHEGAMLFANESRSQRYGTSKALTGPLKGFASDVSAQAAALASVSDVLKDLKKAEVVMPSSPRRRATPTAASTNAHFSPLSN